MAVTQIRGGNALLDGTITRADVNVDMAGNALLRRIIAGTNVSFVSTGADSGTGDVTINVSGGSISTVATRIRRNTNFSVPSGTTWIDIPWETAAYQSGGIFWTSGSDITIPETGLYQIFVEGTFDGAGLIGTINGQLQIVLNNTEAVGADFKQVFVNTPASLWSMAQRIFTAGDQIKVQVQHSNTPTAVNLLAEGTHSPDIIITKIGGAKGDPGLGGIGGSVMLNITDFKGVTEHTETVSAAGLTSTKIVHLSPGASIDTDENNSELLDLICLSATPATDSMTIIATFSSPTSGLIRLNWSAI